MDKYTHDKEPFEGTYVIHKNYSEYFCDSNSLENAKLICKLLNENEARKNQKIEPIISVEVVNYGEESNFDSTTDVCKIIKESLEADDGK